MTNFDYVEVLKPKESGFDLSYSNKFTMDMGDMVPCLVQEVLPNDEFKAKSQFMVRMAPLANPIYTKLNASVHYFFVPNRILWDGGKDNNWEAFITGGKDGTLEPVSPYIRLQDMYNVFDMEVDSADGEGAQTLMDYIGVPAQGEGQNYLNTWINALPFLAYQKIYDDWFRDANVTNSLFDTYDDSWTSGGNLFSTRPEDIQSCR